MQVIDEERTAWLCYYMFTATPQGDAIRAAVMEWALGLRVIRCK